MDEDRSPDADADGLREDRDPAVPRGWYMPSSTSPFAICEPCSRAIGVSVRIPVAQAERHAERHFAAAGITLTHARSVAQLGAVAFPYAYTIG